LVSRVHTLAENSRLLPWLLTVARNLFLSHQRARSMDAHRIRELTVIHTWREPNTSPFDVASADELSQEVERALSTLPQHHKEALLLVGYEGLTPSEAAAICEVSPEAMRQRLSRARASLARELEARGIELQRSARWARNA
jgi:RNA polymerase sigma-70 factor (ECF subfamily)